jgi:hypothetical protein
LHKHKTACDARGFVRSFFGERYIFDIYQSKAISRSVLMLTVVLQVSTLVKQMKKLPHSSIFFGFYG